MLMMLLVLNAAPPAAKPFDARIDEAQQLRVTGRARAAHVARRAGGTPLSVCAKFGVDSSPLCEPCLINR